MLESTNSVYIFDLREMIQLYRRSGSASQFLPLLTNDHFKYIQLRKIVHCIFLATLHYANLDVILFISGYNSHSSSHLCND